jgi:hypothetical protein
MVVELCTLTLVLCGLSQCILTIAGILCYSRPEIFTVTHSIFNNLWSWKVSLNNLCLCAHTLPPSSLKRSIAFVPLFHNAFYILVLTLITDELHKDVLMSIRCCCLLERQHTVLIIQLSMEPLNQAGGKLKELLNYITK